jgi:hypothetical protein
LLIFLGRIVIANPNPSATLHTNNLYDESKNNAIPVFHAAVRAGLWAAGWPEMSR